MRVLSTVLIVLAAGAVPHLEQSTIKVQTELVRVDVLVEQNGTPVAGLTAADFLVEDNGIAQRVSLLRETEDVTVSTILDVSGSMTPQKLTNAGAGIRAVTAALESRDRHALYAFAGEVRRIVPPQGAEVVTADAIARARRETSTAQTSLFDALFAAIVQNDVASGPKMAAVLTDGLNNTSWLSAQSVIDAAIRHETVIYPVAVGNDQTVQFRTGLPPIVSNDGVQVLQVIADRTGGRVIHADWSKDLGPVFDSLIREFRQRYILAFTPERVATRDGWHTLEVKLRKRSGRVHARSGYWSR
jgi:Ca-activated chloride channel homolog